MFCWLQYATSLLEATKSYIRDLESVQKKVYPTCIVVAPPVFCNPLLTTFTQRPLCSDVALGAVASKIRSRLHGGRQCLTAVAQLVTHTNRDQRKNISLVATHNEKTVLQKSRGSLGHISRKNISCLPRQLTTLTQLRYQFSCLFSSLVKLVILLGSRFPDPVKQKSANFK